MPLPIILGVGAAVASAVGVGSGIHGAKKMKEAKDTMKGVEERHKRNNTRLRNCSVSADEAMDRLGEMELHILNGFDKFADTIEKIQNRPLFKDIKVEGVDLPTYSMEELREVSVGTGVLLGGLGGVAANTATVTLSSLGMAAGGGMMLGTAMFSGVGMIAAGVVFNAIGNKLSDKADEAWFQMKEAEDKINKICDYLDDLKSTSMQYASSLQTVHKAYSDAFDKVVHAVYSLNKLDWNDFTGEERLATQNAALLVGLLRKMCKVSLLKKAENTDEMGAVNHEEVDLSIQESCQVMDKLGLKNSAA